MSLHTSRCEVSPLGIQLDMRHVLNVHPQSDSVWCKFVESDLAGYLQVPAAYLIKGRESQPAGETVAAAGAPIESVATDSELQEQAVPDAAQPSASSTGSRSSASAADGRHDHSHGSAAAHTASERSSMDEWLLFNDFAISPAEPDDVRRLYGAQKVPVVLYFRQVRPRTKPGMEPIDALARSSHLSKSVTAGTGYERSGAGVIHVDVHT